MGHVFLMKKTTIFNEKPRYKHGDQRSNPEEKNGTCFCLLNCS